MYAVIGKKYIPKNYTYNDDFCSDVSGSSASVAVSCVECLD
jgi:hypothetical protein